MDISLEEALRLIDALPPSKATVETVEVQTAAGRVLAWPAVATEPIPPFDQSAVDGWAVRLADCRPDGETTLRVGGRLAAGEDAGTMPVASGTAVRIFTGAMLPAGADVVVMQERARHEGSTAVLPPGLRADQNIRRKGAHAQSGDILLNAGRRLRPADLALALGGGLMRLDVLRPPTVGLLSTGSELRVPGTPWGPAGIPDQNGAMLGAMLAGLGASVLDGGVVADDRAVITARLAGMADRCDLVLSTGGVSVGEEDHLRHAVTSLGQLLFWRVAMRPGRPVALGRIGATPILALPGNPVAALTVFELLGRPLLSRLFPGTMPPPHRIRAVAAFTHAPCAGRLTILSVSLMAGGDLPRAMPAGDHRGGLRGLVGADGLALIGAEHRISPGDVIEVLLLTASP